MENEILENGGTQETTTPVVEKVLSNDDNEVSNDKEELSNDNTIKTFTQEEVNDIIKKRVDRAHNTFYKRYGVNDLQALDELFNKVKDYQTMQEELSNVQLKNSELLRENAFLKNNINPEKYNDIIAYFKGTATEFTEENLINALNTHSEWLKPVQQTTTIKSLGHEAHTMPEEDVKSRASKLLGVNF